MSAPLPAIDAFLQVPTPPAWIEAALADESTLLLDHAHCEKKAASTALSLMFRYPGEHDLVARMSRLAREELRHFEQVLALMRKRGETFGHLSPARYAAGLRAQARHHEPARLCDVLIIGAYIEARSCERFAALAPHLPAELASFYRGLHAAEERHFQQYLGFARRYAADEAEFAARVQQFGAVEAALVTRPDSEFRFHSGPPE